MITEVDLIDAVKILEENKEATEFHRAFGISDERFAELDKVNFKEIAISDNTRSAKLSLAIQQLMDVTYSSNEFFYLLYQYIGAYEIMGERIKQDKLKAAKSLLNILKQLEDEL